MEIQVKENILGKNDQIAAEINALLSAHHIFALNLMGSPGSGKTSLLERTVAALQGELRLAVIEGDLFTSKDADRIARQGTTVVQINTSGGCHLDANMVKTALDKLDLSGLDLIIIENVGNLVCPAEFNIGEDARATVLSITEGEDKPLKYPLAFKEAGIVILNKMDLLPYTSFDLAGATEDIVSLNPAVAIASVSCRTGAGLDDWIEWLKRQAADKQAGQPQADLAGHLRLG